MDIRDRALNAISDFDSYSKDKEQFEEGYILGAIEQRKIDIEKAWSFFSELMNETEEGIDFYCSKENFIEIMTNK